MEQLKDEGSTNLYIEGYALVLLLPNRTLIVASSLPLTIDEPVCALSFVNVSRADVIVKRPWQR